MSTLHVQEREYAADGQLIPFYRDDMQLAIREKVMQLKNMDSRWGSLIEYKLRPLQAQCAVIGHVSSVFIPHDECYYCGAKL